MSQKGIIEKEFKGNVLVTVSDHEVRLWVCDLETGGNIFRFKATGKVFHSGQDVTIFANK